MEPIARISGHKEEVRSLAFSSDGKSLASGSSDSTVKIWDVPLQK
jgi:WD40 repeat protein